MNEITKADDVDEMNVLDEEEARLTGWSKATLGQIASAYPDAASSVLGGGQDVALAALLYESACAGTFALTTSHDGGKHWRWAIFDNQRPVARGLVYDQIHAQIASLTALHVVLSHQALASPSPCAESESLRALALSTKHLAALYGSLYDFLASSDFL